MTEVNNAFFSTVSKNFTQICQSGQEVVVQISEAVSTLVNGVWEKMQSAYEWIYPVNLVTNQRELWYLPEIIERMIGTAMYSAMCYEEGGNDTKHLSYHRVQEIGQKLAAQTKRKLDYEISILKNNTLNAWCLPWGKAAIYTLLLEKIEYYIANKDKLDAFRGYTNPETKEHFNYDDVVADDVIAALVGHEFTHADARHAARKLELSFLVQTAIFAADYMTRAKLTAWDKELTVKELKKPEDETLKNERSQLQFYMSIQSFAFSYIVKLGMNLFMYMGSRSHELEADKYGTELAIRAGYNPKGALFLQEILKVESLAHHMDRSSWIVRISELFSSHPPSDIRQKEIYPIVKKYYEHK